MTLYAEKLLPHNIEAEESLIGSLLIDGECIARIAPMLQTGISTGTATSSATTRRWRCSSGTRQSTRPRSPASWRGRKKLDAVGGMAYLSHLVSITPTSVHSEDYAEIVSRTATMRKLIAAGLTDIGAGLQRHRRRRRDAAAG